MGSPERLTDLQFWTRAGSLVAGPLGAILLIVTQPFPGLGLVQHQALAVTFWTALWWMTEPIPIPATSLLPALLFPLLGVLDANATASRYTNSLILLLLGGFLIARAVEVWGLHRRFALAVLSAMGPSPLRLVFGFALCSAALSMGISNTATTLMLVPIALSIARRADPSAESNDGALAPPTPLAIALLLAVAYGANVGGVGSIIGTPPNLIFASELERVEGQTLTIDFRRWLVFGIPTVLLFVPIIAWVLARPLRKDGARIEVASLAEERRALGAWSPEEKRVAIVFAVCALLWMTKGGKGIPGWIDLFAATGWFPEDRITKYVGDTAVALAGAIALFVLPRRGVRTRPLLSWSDVETVPWGMLLLFGGGLAIAGAFEETGLSQWIGHQIGQFASWPAEALIAVVAGVVIFLTEITSNTATTNVLQPILRSVCNDRELHPVVLMLPAALSVSFAFMLPVATAPNAIVFATGRVPIRSMIAKGFVLNLIGVAVVFVIVRFVALPIFAG